MLSSVPVIDHVWCSVLFRCLIMFDAQSSLGVWSCLVLSPLGVWSCLCSVLFRCLIMFMLSPLWVFDHVYAQSCSGVWSCLCSVLFGCLIMFMLSPVLVFNYDWVFVLIWVHGVDLMDIFWVSILFSLTDPVCVSILCVYCWLPRCFSVHASASTDGYHLFYLLMNFPNM